MRGRFVPNTLQGKAIDFPIDTPLKVVAGAGTGKTAVLTQRFARIVEKYGVSPYRTLALTFTKKAAAEMKRRITKELLAKKLVSRSQTSLLLWIGNFHSICLRLLKQNALAVGLDPSFDVLEETERSLILSEVIVDFMNGNARNEADSFRFDELMIERIDDFLQPTLNTLNRVKSSVIGVDSLKKRLGDLLSEQYAIVRTNLNETISNEELHPNSRRKAERALAALPIEQAHEELMIDALYEIHREYERRLKSQNLVDFSDLIRYTHQLVETHPWLKKRFEYILVDEFQDTDSGQYQLLRVLSDGFRNVTVVCDKKQSIYEWREARLENVDEFPGESIDLTENYRSYEEILDPANLFIRQSMPDEKPLVPALEGGRGIAGLPQMKLFRAGSQEEEAEYVAREIGRIINAGQYLAGDVTILMRSVHAARPYELALRSCGIDFTTVGGCGLFELAEIKDAIAVLRLVSDPFDELSMARVLASPVVGLSDAAIYGLCTMRRRATSTLYDVLKRPAEDSDMFGEGRLRRVRAMLETIDELADKRWSLTLGELFSEILDRTGYLKYLAFLEGPRGARFSNVSILYKLITSFEERHPGQGLEEFLAYLDLMIAGNAVPGSNEARPDAVRLMTVHQAKGLEFPVVFIANVAPSVFPLRFRSDSFGFDEENGFFARALPGGEHTVRFAGGYGVGIREVLKRRNLLEECRVMYVAMTRARDLLYVTTSREATGKVDDFFGLIEEAASKDIRRCVEIVDTLPPSVTIGATCGEIDEAMTVDEICQLTTRAVKRISGTPTVLSAPAAGTSLALSYSSLAMFRECPMKYAMRYVYRLPLSLHEDDVNHSHDGESSVLLGNLLHKTLMWYHRKKKAGETADAHRIFEAVAARCPADLRNKGTRMLDAYLQSRLAGIDTLYEEEEFHWRIDCVFGRVLLEGKIDRMHSEGDAIRIVDYKTGKPRSESDRLQLGIYCLAIQAVMGTDVVLASNYYLSTGEEVRHDFTPEELGIIGDGIIEDAQKIADRRFKIDRKEARQHSCEFCSYESFCEFGEHADST